MERVFFPFDAELKTELDEIKVAIQGEQNGMVAHSMGQMAYKKNYGVSYVSLRRIAGQYAPNKRLAMCLWNIGYRETMLLSVLLFPVDALSKQEACTLVEGVPEMELAEFACRDLFYKLPYAAELVDECLKMDGQFAMETAFLLAARLLEQESDNFTFTGTLLERVENCLAANKPTVARAVSNFLKQLGIYSRESGKVMGLVDKLSAAESMLVRWVAEEVRTFVEYTDHKE